MSVNQQIYLVGLLVLLYAVMTENPLVITSLNPKAPRNTFHG